MKRAALAVVSTVAGLVVLLSFKVHSTSAVVSSPPAVVRGGTSTATPSASGSKQTSSSGTKHRTKKKTAVSTKPTTSTTTTYTGNAVDTQYGPVEVSITVTGGHLTNATAVEYPSAQPRDQQINAFAIPQLNAEAKSAGSASIDMVSGATYTSQGYIASLQSALDKAGL